MNGLRAIGWEPARVGRAATVALLVWFALAAAPVAATPYQLDARPGRDLVVGMIGRNEVVVVPGASRGPDAGRARRLTAADLGMRGRYEDYSQLVFDSGDINGDGYGDLVTGGITTAGELEGRVTVVPGGARGPRVDQQYGIDDEAWLWLGQWVVVADVDRDGFADVVTTYWTPGNAGQWPLEPSSERELRVAILWGSADGLSVGRATSFPAPPQRSIGSSPQVIFDVGNVTGDRRREVVVVETAHYGEDGPEPSEFMVCRVGVDRAVACGALDQAPGPVTDVVVGDFVGGRRADVVFSQTWASDSEGEESGRLHVFRGTAEALAPPLEVTQNSRGVPGAAESRDQFGASLAGADVDRDGKTDLAVGVPGENAGAGRVVLLYGDRRGLGHGNVRVIHQDTRGVPEHSERQDFFGSEVSLLDVAGNGTSDLVVAARGEDGSVGAVTTVTSSATGILQSRTATLVRPDDVGIPVDDSPGTLGFGHQLGR